VRLDPHLRRHVLWLLDEADRLDKRAAELDGQSKPAPVAAVGAMTYDWITATLGPSVLRRHANDLRCRAAVLARQERNKQ
jgi:hypothetical protein